MVTFLTVPSGVRSHVLDVAAELQRHGVHVDLATGDDCQPDMASEWMQLTKRPPMQYEAFSHARIEAGEVSVNEATSAFADAITKTRPDVMHLHRLLGYRSSHVQALHCLPTRPALVHTNHDMYGAHLPAVGADVEIHVSDYVRSGLVHQAGRLAGTQDFVIHPFVGADFAPEGPVDDYVNSRPGVKVAAVSRLAGGKGMEISAAIFGIVRRELHRIGRPASFVVCHPPVRALKEEAASVEANVWKTLDRYGASRDAYVVEHGRNSLSPVYRSVDFSLHPATPFMPSGPHAPPGLVSEAFGLTPVEARRSGIPALVSGVGGQSESVPEQFRDLLTVDSDDPKVLIPELAERVFRLATDNDLYRRVAEECIRDALDRFSPQRGVDLLLDAYAAAREISLTRGATAERGTLR